MRTAFVVSALAFVVPALCAPTAIPIAKRAGPVKRDSYIVKFKHGVEQGNVLTSLIEKLRGSDSSITYTYTLFPGFAAILKGDKLDDVRKMPGVESVEEDSILSLLEHEIATPDDVPSTNTGHRGTLISRGDDSRYGKDVTVYGIDTGIYVDHHCFGGRATWGKDFTGEGDQDGNGHGTHTAGTAVCQEYGGAGDAKVIAVKVLAANGSGSLSGVMAGVQYAYDDFKQGNKIAIATMSLGAMDLQNQQKSLDQTVKNAIAGGLHFTIAAGNSNLDAQGFTPARVEEANTIGAVDANKNNEKASFSNWGKVLDVWAPGVNIKSAWIGTPDAENTISGTSMATPHVAGILAVALGKYGQMSPAELTYALKKHAENSVTFSAADTVAGVTSNHLLAQKW
ncbi:unnamed protein product [Rhizoctonia solani]|uniref:Cuticle-degrading protease n=1 Tax=Rhizoctonia solani TaxID=456999 RepID=A0A8H3HQV9_9AGAM|nr:unnamed protein product [Rhizoctonia solani]